MQWMCACQRPADSSRIQSANDVTTKLKFGFECKEKELPVLSVCVINCRVAKSSNPLQISFTFNLSTHTNTHSHTQRHTQVVLRKSLPLCIFYDGNIKNVTQYCQSSCPDHGEWIKWALLTERFCSFRLDPCFNPIALRSRMQVFDGYCTVCMWRERICNFPPRRVQRSTSPLTCLKGLE